VSAFDIEREFDEGIQAGRTPWRRPPPGENIGEGEMDSVEIAGMQVAFQRAGKRPVLVLVHGAVCDSRVWRQQLRDLSDEFTVVAWDAPGCGQSADAPESHRLPDYADCLAALIETLGLRAPHLLGHSFGGALVLELYRRHPTIPASLILVGGYAGWAGSLPADEVSRRVLYAEHAAQQMAGGEWDPMSMPGLFSGLMSAETAGELAGIMADSRPVAARAMAHAVAEADLGEMLADINLPTLLLYGDADQRSPLTVAEALHAQIPKSKLLVPPGLGHECYLESPEQFNDEVRAFLRTISGPVPPDPDTSSPNLRTHRGAGQPPAPSSVRGHPGIGTLSSVTAPRRASNGVGEPYRTTVTQRHVG
jgi:pimeloyl-ACP methyl ester carboxylesterase